MLSCIVVLYNSWMYVIHIDSVVTLKIWKLYQEQQRNRENKKYVCVQTYLALFYAVVLCLIT